MVITKLRNEYFIHDNDVDANNCFSKGCIYKNQLNKYIVKFYKNSCFSKEELIEIANKITELEE